LPQWEASLIRNGTTPRGPDPGLCVSAIITDFTDAAWLVVQISQARRLEIAVGGKGQKGSDRAISWAA
jgi:hypothetical protein